jgi:hypothetical protein
MNIGFYINSTNDKNPNDTIFKALNEAITNHEATDASVFYNDIDFNPAETKFGMFNSTELWAFTGVLVATTLANTMRALKIVNKLKLMYLYNEADEGHKDLLNLLRIKDRVKIITRNKKEDQTVYRLTGQKTTVIPDLKITKIFEAIQ